MSLAGWQDIPTDLLTRVAASDRSVLAPLDAWLRRHRSRLLSEDLAQTVLVALWRLMSHDRGRALLAATRSLPELLRAIATRHRIDEHRKRKRLEAAVRQSVGRRAMALPPDPAVLAVRHEVAEVVLASLGKLKPLQREVLVRAITGEESYAALACAVFGSSDEHSVQRARKMVYRARVKVQKHLKNLSAF